MFFPSYPSIFLCVLTCLSLILHKKLENFLKECVDEKKNFIPWKFSWRVPAKTWDASCFKKGLLEKQQSVPNTCNISLLKKIFFQNLTDAFFKYIKLVIPKILFILVLCNFNFYFKIMWPSPQTKLPPPTIYPLTKIKMPDFHNK